MITNVGRIAVILITKFVSYMLMHINTPCPEKNETTSILGITLTKFNKFSQFLAQFILTFKVTGKL